MWDRVERAACPWRRACGAGFKKEPDAESLQLFRYCHSEVASTSGFVVVQMSAALLQNDAIPMSMTCMLRDHIKRYL
jgi:hypothetical protein